MDYAAEIRRLIETGTEEQLRRLYWFILAFLAVGGEKNMKFNKKVEEILNKQVNAEFWSAFMYLSMSAWFENQGLKGMANWMRVQYLEETSHAMKIHDFIISRGGEAKLAAIDAVPTDWKNITEVFEETYKHECKVTEMIHNCYNVAAA